MAKYRLKPGYKFSSWSKDKEGNPVRVQHVAGNEVELTPNQLDKFADAVEVVEEKAKAATPAAKAAPQAGGTGAGTTSPSQTAPAEGEKK